VGSALAGDADTVARARRARKMLGAGMRQAGIIAAGALYALRHHRERLERDHARASVLAARITELSGLPARAQTNMVLVETPAGEAARYAEAFGRHGVAGLGSGGSIRLVVHLEITDRDVEDAAEGVARAVAAL